VVGDEGANQVDTVPPGDLRTWIDKGLSSSDELLESGEITDVWDGGLIGVLRCADGHVGSSPVICTGRDDAQSSAPVVTMIVTLPDGRTQEVTAAESGLATVSLKDGTEYGFRPTIQDSTPWNRLIVTIFRTATTNAPTQILGEVEVPKVSPPTTPTNSTT
jgi:hypothetical protein